MWKLHRVFMQIGIGWGLSQELINLQDSLRKGLHSMVSASLETFHQRLKIQQTSLSIMVLVFKRHKLTTKNPSFTSSESLHFSRSRIELQQVLMYGAPALCGRLCWPQPWNQFINWWICNTACLPPRHIQINVYHPHKDHRNAPPIRKFTDGENDLHHHTLIGWSRTTVTFLLTGTPCALIAVSFLGTGSNR